MFNLWILELQDIMEIKNMHKSKKSFENISNLSRIGRCWAWEDEETGCLFIISLKRSHTLSMRKKSFDLPDIDSNKNF